jgi:hypothetical protein
MATLGRPQPQWRRDGASVDALGGCGTRSADLRLWSPLRIVRVWQRGYCSSFRASSRRAMSSLLL